MKKNIFILMLFTFSLFSCYEDKGNYKYTDVEELIIEIDDFKGTMSSGDILDLKPTFNRDVSKDSERYKFTWSVDGKHLENGDKKELYWVVDTVGEFITIAYEVLDKKTGINYIWDEYITFKGEFESSDSWIVLSEKDGKKILSFVKEVKNDNWETVALKVKNDIYGYANDGATLDATAFGFQEHFSKGGDAIGQFMIFQNNPVDLNGKSFETEMELKQAFDSGTLPAKITGGSFMSYFDILSDEKGQLYTRIKSTDKLFHSNHFLSTPIKYNDEVLEGCKVIRGRYNSPMMGTLIHDTKKQRLLFVLDGGISSESYIKYAGQISELPSPSFGTTPEKYFSLTDMSDYEVIKITPRYDPSGYSMIVKERATGKYFHQAFFIKRSFGSVNYTVGNIVVQEIVGLNFVPDIICIPPYSETEYYFFAQGGKLYMFNAGYAHLGIKEYLDFSRICGEAVTIAAMDSDSWWNKNMGIALSNGEFFVLPVVGANNFETDEEKITVKTEKEDRLGRAIQVGAKLENGNGW